MNKTQQDRFGVPALVLAALLSTAFASARAMQSRAVDATAKLPLVEQSALVYRGSFRVPLSDTGDANFAYGGTALAFSSEHSSLYVVGHDWHQRVAEIEIPDIRKSANVRDLATATLLQPLTDATEGKIRTLNPGDPNAKKVGGLLPYGDKLYISAYSYYDGAGTQVLSHFVRSRDLSVSGDVGGPFRVGRLKAGYVSGYMGIVPSAWRTALGGPAFTGQCCIAIVGRTSYGPALFTFDPLEIGVKNPVPATPLVYYPGDTPLGNWDGTNPYYNGSTEVRGVVMPEGTRSVLFFGRHGVGPFCYGAGTTNQSLAGTKMPNGVKYCHDPEDDSKGTHGYPYAYYVWAYDALDLAAAKSGHKRPWQLKPYAIWKLELPFHARLTHLNGAAYDAATGRIFLSQGFADTTKPVIHVFTVDVAQSPPAQADIAQGRRDRLAR
jgi:hypothetical protein